LEAIMFPIIRARWDARRLAHKLRNSLAAPEDNWKIGKTDEGQPTLTCGTFRIELVPRTARVFDAIHLYNDGAEVWLPLLARLRLRAAARWRLIQDASEHLQETDQKKARARRPRTNPAA
jgi:hypothetical protein